MGQFTQGLRWVRKNLFSTPLDTFLTLLALGLGYALLAPAIQWLIVNAQWQGTTPADCPDKGAACWPFIRMRWDQFIFGLYPPA